MRVAILDRAGDGVTSDGEAGVRASERERLLRAAGGDEDAMRQIYREHADAVFRTACRVLGSSDAELDDVVQHTFLAAIDGAARFDGRSRLSTWLIGIATRRALDHARARHRRGRWARLREWAGLSDGASVARPDAQIEGRSLAERALAELTPDQRVVFVLHQVEGHTLQEIADMTDTGISTLHARLGAARKRLDAFLAREGAQTPEEGGAR
ncbi:MAG: RNA polymerase sigma factor [Deltaproteobacteria bacterium]|jgi:RNA polymerase sigma-70 factor (ECF subfamily)